MNTSLMIFTAIVSIGAIIAVYCGIKLYDISSSFVPIIKHGALPLGVIVTVLTIINCAYPTVSEEINITLPATVAAISAIIFMIAGFALSLIKDSLSKHDKDKELSFAGPFIVDLIGGLITAGAFGCAFAMGSSFALLAATCFVLFLIKEKVALIYSYKDEWSRKKVIVDIAIPLILIPIVAVSMTFLCSHSVAQDATMIAITCGYLIYHAAFHTYFIAKSIKK